MVASRRRTAERFRRDDDADMRPSLVNLPCKLIPVHFASGYDIGYDKAQRVVVFQKLEGRVRRPRFDNLEAFVGDHVGRVHTHQRLVVYHEGDRLADFLVYGVLHERHKAQSHARFQMSGQHTPISPDSTIPHVEQRELRLPGRVLLQRNKGDDDA